ncbi:MAG: serpin family protein [Muribaculaceae bacterium]|nr:serpin family protein [Muribaculaceae bacterium]
MKQLIYAIAAASVMALGACSETPEQARPEEPTLDYAHQIELSTPAKVASRNASQLDVKIFQGWNNIVPPDSNAIIAPLNLTTYLGMFSNLIEDEDFNAAICDFFGTTDKRTVNELVSEYMSQLSSLDSRTKVNFFNKIWYDQNYTLVPAVVEEVEKYYTANFEPADFSNKSELVSEIREWVNRKTDGMINDWGKNVMPNDFLAAQVFTFDGLWAAQFDLANTKEATFHTPYVSTTVRVDMMNGMIPGKYFRTDTYQVARLEFGGGVYVADFILPNAGEDIVDVISEPDFGMWTDEAMQGQEFKIAVPKFSLNETLLVDEVLADIDPRIDLWKKQISFFEENKKISTSICQQVALNVDESGAKVASVTYNGDIIAAPCVELNFNRPFAMMIRLRDTGAVLAAARIVNPKN